MKKIGFLINPVAGLGGLAGMKGSDDYQGQENALSLGYQKTASGRGEVCLRQICKEQNYVVLTPPGEMGETALGNAGIPCEVVTVEGAEQSASTTREDTIAYACLLKEKRVDLLVFCGGDGTARDIYEAVGGEFPVLGVPAGVKMYSACYAVNPWQAGELLRDYIRGKKLPFAPREVMDIDEAYISQASVSPALYGFLNVLGDGVRLQRAKEAGGGNEDETERLAMEILSEIESDTLYIIGPGGTTFQIKKKMCGYGTLRGVDIVKNGRILKKDADEKSIYALLEQEEKAKIIVTCIGGNGFLFGRGNQQISPRIIKRVKKENIQVAVTMQKLAGLETRPMLVDTGDVETDRYLSGYYKIQFNAQESALYKVERME